MHNPPSSSAHQKQLHSFHDCRGCHLLYECVSVPHSTHLLQELLGGDQVLAAEGVQLLAAAAPQRVLPRPGCPAVAPSRLPYILLLISSMRLLHLQNRTQKYVSSLVIFNCLVLVLC